MSWFRNKSPSKKGMTHSYVNYQSSHSSHRYEAKTQEIIRFPAGMPIITDYEPSSPRKPLLMPWGSFRDQPEKGEGFSPRFHVKDAGSPRKDVYKANSPTARDHQLGKFSSFRDRDDDTESDGDDSDYDYVCDENGVCVRNYKRPVSKQNHLKDESYVRNNDKYRAKGYETNYEHAKPIKQPYYEKSYDDLDLEKEKETGKFSAPKYTANKYNFPSSNHPKQDTYYEKNPSHYNEKDQGKPKHHLAPGYTAPPSNPPKREPYYGASYTDHTSEEEKQKYHAAYSHAAPPANQPKKDAYYDKAPTYYNDKRHENGYNPPYTVPTTTIPRKDQRYERSNSMPIVPPPIKTRVDRGRDAEYYNENGRNNSPRKNHQGYGETTDNMEMRRGYGKPVPQVESYEEKYSAVIDAREAARRYKGVLLTS